MEDIHQGQVWEKVRGTFLSDPGVYHYTCIFSLPLSGNFSNLAFLDFYGGFIT